MNKAAISFPGFCRMMLKDRSANLTRVWYGQAKYTPIFSNMLFITRYIKAFTSSTILSYCFNFNCGFSIGKYFRS